MGYEVSEGADNTLVLLFQDITEQVRTRTERDRLLQLATVDEVLPTVLHELRNPLAAVTLAVEVLLEECEPRDDPELTEALHTVLAELRRMSLVFQGIGVGGRSLRMTQVAAVDVAVREVARIMDRLAQQSGVTLHVDVQVLPLLPFDPAVVKAIVFNLLSNSIYACHQGGHIKVSLRPRTSSSLLLRVTDDGHGMSADVLSDCTRPFFTTRANGSGLGLVVCREAVEEAGGTLDIRSAPGQGTRVSIELPLTRPLVSIQDSTSRSARRRRLRDTDETDS
ncbi:MAG: ATP-binding protein [bacterium]